MKLEDPSDYTWCIGPTVLRDIHRSQSSNESLTRCSIDYLNEQCNTLFVLMVISFHNNYGRGSRIYAYTESLDIHVHCRICSEINYSKRFFGRDSLRIPPIRNSL